MCAHGREREGEKDKFTSIYQSALEDDRDCKEMATSSMYEDVHMYESNAYKFIRTAPKGHKMMIPNTPKIDIDNNNNTNNKSDLILYLTYMCWQGIY